MLTRNEAARVLRDNNRFLILTHRRPDGDTLGSAAALCLGLRLLGKTAWVLQNPEVTPRFSFLLEGLTVETPPQDTFIVSTDVASPSMLPAQWANLNGKIRLRIDHHASSTSFTQWELVEPDSASCAEIVWELLRLLQCPADTAVFRALYVGISTDTGCFAYGNTTARTHAVTAALMETGIDVYPINKTFFGTKTRRRMALEADMLVNADYFDGGRCVFLYVPMSLMERLHATETDAEDLSSLGRQIEGVDCAVTFRELRPDVWKLSVRTDKRVNATKVCARMGGGGHPAAAGCTMEAPLNEVKEAVLASLRAEVADFEG